MDTNLQVILQQLQAEKRVDRHTLVEAIETALQSAARKSFPPQADITVEFNPNNFKVDVFEIKEVVDEVEDPALQMPLEEGQALNPKVKVGDRLKIHSPLPNFGRIGAQTAKQVIIQQLRDVERHKVYEEYKDRVGEVVTGVVRRGTHANMIVSVDGAEAVLPQREQSPRENFKPGDRIRAYLKEVEESAKGPQIVLSRTSPQLVHALFKMEVPEIFDGTIQIKAIAREPGARTKIAVLSTDSNVDAVGACVGMRGSRVRAVVEELCGEKIDIVRWSEDPVDFCGNALNPADILDMKVDEESKTLSVIVPHDQLSLAIGKRGQNARLASRLMGWNIDIQSDAELTGESPPPQDAHAIAEAVLGGGSSEDSEAGDKSQDPEASEMANDSPEGEDGLAEAVAETDEAGDSTPVAASAVPDSAELPDSE